MIRLSIIFVITASIIFTLNNKSFADTERKFLIEKSCKELFPNTFSDFFDRKECINEQMREIKKIEQEKEEKKKAEIREINARQCIAGDLTRMENLYKNIKQTIDSEFNKSAYELNNQNLNPTDLKSTLKQSWSDIQFFTKTSEDNIRENVIIFSINTICDSDFNFLINIRLNKDGFVKWFAAWVKNPPKGYNDTALENNDYLNYEKMFERANNEKKENIKKQQMQLEAIELQRKKDEEKYNKLASPNNPGYLIDKNNNCRVWDPNPKKDETVKWEGSCKNGLADGEGTVTWQYIENGKQTTHIVKGYYKSGDVNEADIIIYNDNTIIKSHIKDNKTNGNLQLKKIINSS